MSKPKVGVIDYGMGNLLSVRRGFEYCNAEVTTTSDRKTILEASHIVLPGVGAFGCAMDALINSDLIEVIHSVVNSGKPFFGICLGMQLLLSESEEFGLTKGLGLIPGRVVPIPTKSSSGMVQKIPHIGWGALKHSSERVSCEGTLLKGIPVGASTYFVHSFMVKLDDPEHSISECVYGDQTINAIIMRDNIMGCQFHPEKSGKIGLDILKNFLLI